MWICFGYLQRLFWEKNSQNVNETKVSKLQQKICELQPKTKPSSNCLPYLQVAAGSNLLFTGHIDGADNIFREKFRMLFSKANKLKFNVN